MDKKELEKEVKFYKEAYDNIAKKYLGTALEIHDTLSHVDEDDVVWIPGSSHYSCGDLAHVIKVKKFKYIKLRILSTKTTYKIPWYVAVTMKDIKGVY